MNSSVYNLCMTNNTFAWPPEYKVRKSGRAKRLQLQYHPNKGLHVVVPSHLKRFNITRLLDENRQWIVETLSITQQAPQKTLPHELQLNAIGETWQISYEQRNRQTLLLKTQQPCQITLQGPINNFQNCVNSLKRWLSVVGKQNLLPMIRSVSEEIQLPFTSASIRGQQTRWGSCSADKRITLNYKLLFLPPALTRHVLIHELCHTVHLDHSKNFWTLLRHFDAHCDQSRQQLKSADQFIPRCFL